MKTEHTPGPWRTDGDLSTSLDVVSNDARVAMIDELSDLTDEQLIANSKLIAAAPDLLRALVDLLDDQRDASLPVLDRARAAVYKAIGA